MLIMMCMSIDCFGRGFYVWSIIIIVAVLSFSLAAIHAQCMAFVAESCGLAHFLPILVIVLALLSQILCHSSVGSCIVGVWLDM